jgi:tryptophan-rich hypothetical protein
MNRINPNKLLLSKWTAVAPQNRERHFLVRKLLRDEGETVIGCELEAVINHHIYRIDWQELTNTAQWKMGWK